MSHRPLTGHSKRSKAMVPRPQPSRSWRRIRSGTMPSSIPHNRFYPIRRSGGAVAAGDVDLQQEEEESGYSEEAKLFVGNLPYDVDSERLAQLFEPAGVVEIAEVIYSRETDQRRGFGFVTMSAVEEAEKAVKMFNRYVINGRFLTVNKAAPRGTRPELLRTFEPSSRIYVGNLPWDVDNSRLEKVFIQYGNVTSARVVFDRETALDGHVMIRDDSCASSGRGWLDLVPVLYFLIAQDPSPRHLLGRGDMS